MVVFGITAHILGKSGDTQVIFVPRYVAFTFDRLGSPSLFKE